MLAKVVSFGEISERCIPDLNLSEQERESLWFSSEQMRAFRREAYEDRHACTRISASRYNQRRNYIRYVLKIQRYNKSVGMEDPTGLGAVAVALSKSAMENARFRANKVSCAVAAEVAASRNIQQQGELYTTETETDIKQPGIPARKAHVAINTPKRNRTAANMA